MKKSFRLFAVFVVCAVIAIMSVSSLPVDAGNAIYNGIYIGEVNVSGMTSEQAKAAVEQYIDTMKNTEINLVVNDGQTVSVKIGDFNPTWDNPEVIDQATNVVSEGNVVARYKAMKDIEHNGMKFDLIISFDEALMMDFIQEKCTIYDEEVENATLSRENGQFIIVDGEPGLAVDVFSSATLLQNTLYEDYIAGTTDINLVVQLVQPEGSAEELAMVKDLLGTYTTSFTTSNSNRSANVNNGCRLINGTTLYPGEEFSAYNTVKPFSEANGYYLAGSYMNGQVVDSLGGGICQVSTTLYNAVLLAELEVTERYPHSMVVSYVDKSADAAIAESSGKDFRFVNNTDHPIYIEGYTENKHITFNIYGVEYRDPGHSVKYVSEVLSETVPDTENIIADAGQGVGYVSVTSAHIGYRAKLWKITYENGVEVSREEVNSSTYAASPRTAVVGVGTADPNRYNQIMAAIASGSIDTCKGVAAQLLVEEQNAAAEAQQQQGVTEVPEL